MSSTEPSGGFAPEQVLELFQHNLFEERFGRAYELVTVDEDGRPRVAMLSHGEILTVNDRLRIGLWPGSQTSINLKEGRPFLLSVVAPGSVWYLMGKASSLPQNGNLARFELRIEEARSDRHVGFSVVGPITFKADDDMDQAISDWNRQHEMLLE